MCDQESLPEQCGNFKKLPCSRPYGTGFWCTFDKGKSLLYAQKTNFWSVSVRPNWTTAQITRHGAGFHKFRLTRPRRLGLADLTQLPKPSQFLGRDYWPASILLEWAAAQNEDQEHSTSSKVHANCMYFYM